MRRAVAVLLVLLWALASPLLHAADETAPPTVAAMVTVDINHDGAEALAAGLDGVGLKKAQAIIDYRTTHGPFQAVDDLTQVKGIGTATVERNRDRIVINP